MKQKFTDPITKDELSVGEYASWKVQGIIRRWAFLGAITLITVLVWISNNQQALLWWNLSASYMALVIESVVGMSMFHQTRRDAVFIRHINHLEEHNAALLERIDKLLEQQSERTL